MVNQNNPSYWEAIYKKNKNKNLIFIHTPKTGGTFVKVICNNLNITHKGHRQATNKDNEQGITFTIIRDPIKRFESLINYRLDEAHPRTDWPNELKHVHYNKSIGINKIVNGMSIHEIQGFSPYRTLNHWTKNVQICITIDKLEDFLNFFGYEIDINKYNKKNISKRERGYFNDKTKQRLNRIYKNDIELYHRKVG